MNREFYYAVLDTLGNVTVVKGAQAKVEDGGHLIVRADINGPLRTVAVWPPGQWRRCFMSDAEGSPREVTVFPANC